jgi:hypothetical protein
LSPDSPLKDSPGGADETDMRQLFMPGAFVGVGLIAVWVHVRFPRLQPSSLKGATVHTAASFAVFSFVPVTLHAIVIRMPVPWSVIAGVTVLIVPTFCYVLLSWLWLLARIRDHAGSSPRGGHPVQTRGR